ncbi:MAG: hypothetical protein HY721_08870 [Planctomycetes bacterium]|nr:hypothetical protein [Planctomycetota bacterium]
MRIPRIVVRRPRAGRVHPAGKSDIVALLSSLGPEGTYGVKSIELVEGDDAAPGGLVRLGRLSVPGRILLYDQRAPPWSFVGRLAEPVVARLAAAGAAVEESTDGLETVVRWPGKTLRDFMLFEGLLHGIGHHLLQHHKGKRTARVARSRDHEAFARRFVRRCRAALAEAGEGLR